MAPPRKPAITTSQMVGSRVKHVLRLDMSRSALLPNERRLIWTGRPQIPLSPQYTGFRPNPTGLRDQGTCGWVVISSRRAETAAGPSPRREEISTRSRSVGARTGATDYAPTQTRATRLRRRSEAVCRSTVNPAPRWQAKQGRRWLEGCIRGGGRSCSRVHMRGQIGGAPGGEAASGRCWPPVPVLESV
jgi:hypothetical protein